MKAAWKWQHAQSPRWLRRMLGTTALVATIAIAMIAGVPFHDALGYAIGATLVTDLAAEIVWRRREPQSPQSPGSS